MVLVKYIFSIILRVKKGQCHSRTGIRIQIEVVSVQVVGFHKVPDQVPHLVVTRFTDESSRNLEAAQRYHGVERRSSRNGYRGLIVRKQNVKDGLSYADDFAHDGRFFTKIHKHEKQANGC